MKEGRQREMIKQDNDPVCGLTGAFKRRRMKFIGLLFLFTTAAICITFNPISFSRSPKKYHSVQTEKLIRISLPFTNLPDPNDTESSSMIFLETSGRASLKTREGCALESAALHNPQRTVLLYSISQIDAEDAIRVALRNISNVKFEFLDVTTLFAGTPLNEWYTSGKLTESSFPIQHLSDAARLAILWKNGGVYLDTDMISIHPLRNLSNALGYGSGNVGNSALAFQRGHPFLLKCMEDYVLNYTKTAYDFHGPKLVTRVFKKVCFEEDLSKVINKPELCQGITLLPDHTFYAFPWMEWKKLFEDARNINVMHSYTVHMYAKMSAETTGKPGDGSLLDALSMTNCPTTYQLMVNHSTL